MNAIVIGARILDVLTTGMYPDALDALREYVQNSYDAIRRAEQAGIYKPNFGEVTIKIDTEKRVLTIRDNGIGIPSAEAASTLLSIGASKKRVGVDAGFRGIGRLAGLAYCDTLVFITAYKDEAVQTELTFDAVEIRKSISPTSGTEAETASDLLLRLTKPKLVDRKPGPPFFEVKMINIDPKSCPFLKIDEVKAYLKQVSPVEFNMQAFNYGNSKINPFLEIHNAHRTINLTVTANDRSEPIYKPFKTYHDAGNKNERRVDIVDIEMTCDPNDPPRWVAWLSKARDLKGAINTDETRGIRFRSNNIQIGDGKTFARIFEKVQKSYSRFNSWYSGEVHILDSRIIPNSRRDFFEDNDDWRAAETTLIDWAKPLVTRVYQNSNERNRDVGLMEADADQVLDEVGKQAARGFAADDLRQKAIAKLEEQEARLGKAMTSDRSPEELETLQRKKAEAAAAREKVAAKPRSLIDESALNRDERKILRLVMDAVTKVCGDELATKAALEVDKQLKSKRKKS